MRIGSLHAYGQELDIHTDCYRNKRLALHFLQPDEGEAYGVLTVNIPEASIGPDEILVKTWSENEPFREPALATGLFRDTGRRVPTGCVMAEAWQLTPRALALVGGRAG